MSGSRAHKRIQVDMFTATMRLSGKVDIPIAGLVALLSATQDSNVAMKDTYISRAMSPSQIIERYNNVIVPKDNLEMVIPAQRKDVGITLVSATNAATRFYKVLITTPSYEFHGELEQAGRLNIGTLLTGKGFLALYEATAVVAQRPDIEFSNEIIMINRDKIGIIANNLVSV